MNGLSNFWVQTSQDSIDRNRCELLLTVKRALKAGDGKVTYYNGWVRINNEAFNGIRETDIIKLQEEIDNE